MNFSGSAYAGVDGLIYLAIGAAALLTLAVLGGLISYFRRTRGWIRWIGLPVFAGLWVVPLWQCHERILAEREADTASSALRAAAVAACEGERSALPEEIRTRGVIDEGPGIEAEVLQGLLARGVGFVELRADGWSREGRLFVYPAGAASSASSASSPAAPGLVRLALSREGDPDCVSGSALRQVAGLHEPPFAPGGCLALSFPTTPQAQLALSRVDQDDGAGANKHWPHWQLADRVSGEVVARLATSGQYDGYPTSSFGSFPERDASRRVDCNFPRKILLGRLVGAGDGGVGR